MWQALSPVQRRLRSLSMTGQAARLSALLLRLALGASFLSAVADRFGLWGPPGSSRVAWGDFSRFALYTGQLLWFLPQGAVLLFAWLATIAEIVLGLALVLGLFPRVTALLSGVLLFTFAFFMTVALGVKAPLDYSVFTACAAAFVLATGDIIRRQDTHSPLP